MMRLIRFVFFSALLFCVLLLAGLHVHAAESDFEWIENADGTVTITYYHDPVKPDNHVVVPERLGGKTVTAIGDRAFRYAYIVGVTLPDTVTSIGTEAFELCRVLKNVKLPSGLVSIGNHAFNYNQISHITLPDSLEHIGFSAFSYNKLTSVSFPSGIKTMDQFAFWHNEITSVSFPESMTKIPNHTFVDNKLTSITIPKHITEIGSHAFSANPLTEVTILSAATQLRRDSILEVGSQLTVYGHSESPAQKFALTNGYLFEPLKMKVAYDGNGHTGGDVPVDDKSYVRWDEATVLGNTGLLERPGYRFDGWNTAPDGSGADYAVNSRVRIEEEDVILYAKWEQACHTVTFDTKEGSVIPSQVLAHNTLASEPNAPTKPGYAFEGWYLDEDFMTKWNFAVDRVTSDITLHAKWDALPTVVLSTTASGTVNAAFSITITFSEPVIGFSENGIEVTNGMVSNLVKVNEATYMATIVPFTSGQEVTARIVANAAIDAAGNGNVTSSVLSVMYDTTKPVVIFDFMDHQIFSAPPTTVHMSVSEAVYWVTDGSPLTSSNALALLSMEKDGVIFSDYAASYDEASFTYTFKFHSTLTDGEYKINVAGNKVMNARNNTLDATSTSFIVAVPIVSVPSAPLNVTAEAGDGQAKVSFHGPENDGGSPILSYSVTAWVNGTATPITQSGDSSPIIVTGLTNGTTYTFTIVATNAKGNSVPSVPSNPVTPKTEQHDPDTEAPRWPDGSELTVSDITQTSLKLTWPSATDYVGVAGYRIYVNGTEHGTVGGNVNGTMINGLTANSSYTFKVTAYDAAGNESAPLSKQETTARSSSGGGGGSGGGFGGGHTLSGNADLVDLQVWVGGKKLKLSPSFASGTTDYKARTEAEQVEIVAKEAHSSAKVILKGKVITDGTKVNLDEGDNTFVLTVQAENGIKKEYTLHIHRKTPKPSEPEVHFIDIAGHWAETNIKRAAAKGMVSGYPDGTFKPNHFVTRAEFTVMLTSALQLEEEGATLTFIDQDQIGIWAKQSVAKAEKTGIVSGYGDGSFRPNAQITRAEMAVMIARALKLQLKAETATGFADDEAIPQWAKGAVEAIRGIGIVDGRGGNRFVPNEKATRAEAAVILLRMIERGK
ncbi:leucine-rich repeat protein [Paenibacillus sp. MSJ-34]|uniref:leucine-rich repeat protein n=1 Tax=Paenibacillus sp. MSJ-34 TaxID=2841529 RepID=UPI001C0F6C6F|nr:leucine-rich repeat protein [Paenibacillus sp. MSJ-34]MBU5444791.1 leucine-rich repeat protein [Paenibacillus sp. MSJ-34]